MLAISLVSYYCIVLLIRTKNGIVSELRAKRPAQAEAGAPNPPISSSMSFQEIGFHTFGPRGQRFVEVSIVVLQLSFVAAYVVFIGKQQCSDASQMLAERTDI